MVFVLIHRNTDDNHNCWSEYGLIDIDGISVLYYKLLNQIPVH